MKKELLMAVAVLCLAGTACAGSLMSAPAAYATGKAVEKPLVINTFIELRQARAVEQPIAFKDLQGRAHTLSDFRSRLVVQTIWASWCEPCLREIPALIKLQKKHADSSIRFIGLSVDNKAKDVPEFLKANGLESFDTWIDPNNKIGDFVPLDVIPTALFYDGSGNVIGFVRGYVDWADAAVEPFLQALAAKYAGR